MYNLPLRGMLKSRILMFFRLFSCSAPAESVPDLDACGYAVVPKAQRVTLSPKEFRFGEGWALARKIAHGPASIAGATDSGNQAADLCYMVRRELLLPLGDGFNRVRATRNHYARTHNLPLNNQTFDWSGIIAQ